VPFRVEVRIGRIEVNVARPAAAPPAAPARASRPAVGLDDYLRRRREG
jgi:hypothetical protein